MFPTGCVRIQGSPLVVFTLGVRFRMTLMVNPPLGGEPSAINVIFVHPLYGPVQLNGGGSVRLTQAVYKLCKLS